MSLSEEANEQGEFAYDKVFERCLSLGWTGFVHDKTTSVGGTKKNK